MSSMDDYMFLSDMVRRKRKILKKINVDSDFDPNKTKQENDRDKQITNLLKLYVKSYKHKVYLNLAFKISIFVACIGILIAAFVGIFILTTYMVVRGKIEVTGLTTIISSLVSFLVLIISLLKIITTYVFPPKDEEYIANLVKMIQNNDLEHVKIRKHLDSIEDSKFEK